MLPVHPPHVPGDRSTSSGRNASRRNHIHETSWFALGAFAVSVVTMPALLDRRCTLVDAVAISLKTFRDNPRPMLFRAALITVMFGLSMLTAFVALIVVSPWLGLAMWHGYREMVVPERGAGDAGIHS